MALDLQTRNHYLRALGIPVWVPKDEVADVAAEAEATSTRSQPAASAESLAAQSEPHWSQQPPQPEAVPLSAYADDAASEAASLNSGSAVRQLLEDTLHSPASGPQSQTPAPAAVPLPDTSGAPDCSQMDWAELQQVVSQCQLCSLHKSRTQTVFGSGNQQADWMIIGEAPGAEEDRQGEPFVGRAGKLLNNMLAAAGLSRSVVYIGNVLKCRPPNNRDPKPEESALCRGYLERQIALVQPKLIMVVGRIAAHHLLQVKTPLGRLRGQVHTLPETAIPVLVSYHPAYLLRQPAEKRKAWQDLQLARTVMQRNV